MDYNFITFLESVTVFVTSIQRLQKLRSFGPSGIFCATFYRGGLKCRWLKPPIHGDTERIWEDDQEKIQTKMYILQMFQYVPEVGFNASFEGCR